MNVENTKKSKSLMSIDIRNIGQRIQKARKARKLSQTELGERVHLSRVTISQIENGKRRHINPMIIQHIAQALNKPEEYFYDLPQERCGEKIPAKVTGTQNSSSSLNEVVKKLFLLPVPQQNKAAHLIAELLSWRETQFSDS